MEISFIWPWVGPEASNILNMGPGRVQGSTRVVPLPTPPSSHHPGYTSSTTLLHAEADTVLAARAKEAVGLISVGQLSLWVLFSVLQGITEVYNLVETGRIINHSVIPGNE